MGKIEVVDIDTNQGTIELALYADKAPLTVQNFLGYAEEGFYDNTIIHRVIRDFIIQGGGLTAEFTVKPVKDAIKSEARNGLKNRRGTIAMARTGVIDSATTQFFINLKDNSSLDHRNDTVEGYGYAVFGEVIAGLEIVDRIAAIPTGEKLLDPENKRGLYVDVPVETVVVKTIKRKTISR
ncbi:peptidylprolyl isomerase [bacterium]|nr:peptidylprolyl isomerase [candidate division CSSED10-310 bacterium]